MALEPWLKDDPSKPKIFTLAGFFPTSRISAEEIKSQKDEIIKQISKLGGRYVDKDEWDPSVTHVINFVDGKKDGMSEKVMAGIAAGRWVLTKRYVQKSYKNKEWIETPKLFAPNDAVITSRKKWFLQGPRGGPFWNMKAALVMEDERKRGVYTRIIVAGGGEVKDVHSLRSLEANPVILEQLTHIFMDPWEVNSVVFRNIKSEAEAKSLHIWFLHYKYLFLKIRGSPVPTEMEHSVLNPQVREMGEKERRQFLGKKGCNLRSKRSRESDVGNGRKRQRTAVDEDIVVLSDDECTILDDKDSVRNVNPTETVGVGIDTDDDDDISVLVQKLASSRAEAGNGRQYMERGKATGVLESYKQMCEQQRREQLGNRRKSGEERTRGNHRKRGREGSSSVQVISISDDETELVTLDDSDDEVRFVHGSPLSTSVSISHPQPMSHLDRSPSPILMELDQDEREDSGDESVEPDTRALTLVETAPEVFDVLSDDDEDEIQVVPVYAGVSPTFSVDDDESCPDSPGEEQGHASDTSFDRKTGLSMSSRTVRPGAGVIEEVVEPSLEEYEVQYNMPRRHEEIIRPSLDFNGKSSSTDQRNAEEIRKAIFRLANEEVRPTESSLQCNDTSLVMSNSLPKEKDKVSERLSSPLFSDILERKEPKKSVPLRTDPNDAFAHKPVNEADQETSDVSLEAKDLCSKTEHLCDVDPQPETLSKSKVKPVINLNLAQPPKTKVPDQRILTEEPPAPILVTPLPAPSSPVPVVSQSVTKTTLFHRIIASIVKRMSFTDEGIAITNISSRSARFDKHCERRAHADVRQMNPNIEMDFSAYFVKVEENDIPIRVKKKKNMSVEDDFKDEGITSNDSVATVRRIIIETTSTAFPTSSILHVVIKKLLLDGMDHVVRIKAYDYLNHFLFLHLGKQGMSREQWLILILSAMRNLPEMKMFKSFDIENSHDISDCYRFFKNAVNLFLMNSGEAESLQGPQMFFEFLVKLMQKDFEQWWKHWRKTDTTKSVSYPLMFYMLGGSRSTFVKNISKTVIKMYSQSLEDSVKAPLLQTIRKLVSITALLASHLDSMDGNTSLYLGDKVVLASLVGDLLQDKYHSDIYIELSLLQPNWLSLLVSRYIMKRRGVEVGESLACLKNLKLEDKLFSRNIENWSHRLCGLQQAHAVFRANWHFVSGKECDQFKDFKHLSRLEDKGTSIQNKMVKMEDVGLRLSKVVESVNTIREVANSNSMGFEKQDDGDLSALSSLFFKMTFVNKF